MPDAERSSPKDTALLLLAVTLELRCHSENVNRPHLSAIWLYPVKGLRGHTVTSAKVEARGLAGDRRCMVVDGDGRFLTQRARPDMVRVSARWLGDAIVLANDDAEVTIPLAASGPTALVEVWSSRVRAVELEAGSAFLSAALSERCRLVVLPEDERRPVTSASGRPGDEVSFADAFPFLLASTSSLDDLAARAKTTLTMERFRPNFVASGLGPWEEDELGAFMIGDVRFTNRKPCDRCAVTLVDPETGRSGKEPLKTLATFREREGKVYFGVNLVAEGNGTVRVGDRIAR